MRRLSTAAQKLCAAVQYGEPSSSKMVNGKFRAAAKRPVSSSVQQVSRVTKPLAVFVQTLTLQRRYRHDLRPEESYQADTVS